MKSGLIPHVRGFAHRDIRADETAPARLDPVRQHRAQTAGAPAFPSQGHQATSLFLDGAVVFSFKINAHAHLIMEL